MEKQVVGLMSVDVRGLILSRLCFRAERGGVVFGHKRNAASLFVPNPHWFNLLNM